MFTLPPPLHTSGNLRKNRLKLKSEISTVVALALLSLSGQASSDVIFGQDVTFSGPDENGWVTLNGNGAFVDSPGRYTLILVNNSGAETEWLFENSLRIDHHPQICQSQFSIQTIGGTLTLTGDLDYKVTADTIASGYDQGTHAFYALKQGQLNLTGQNISIEVRHNLSDGEQLSKIGANGIYISEQSNAVIGREGGTTRLWVLAGQPDLISAKKGSTVTFQSTTNQLIGSIDMMDDPNPSGTGNDTPNRIDITLSGENSYWFGDEKTWQNSALRNDKIGFDSGDTFNLILEDGAQWSYLAQAYVRDKSKLYWSIPKRISKVTLNGGIINLFDKNLQDTWQQIGLWDALNNGEYDYDMHPEYRHDYVVVGDLQGSGGIFRMDLNAVNKKDSDMLYIEAGGASDGSLATHYFEPYRLDLLKPITPDNTLTFALVKKGANIKFVDKENLEGDGLWNYELYIDKKNIEQKDIDENRYYWEHSTTLEHEEDTDAEGNKNPFTFTVDPDEYLGGQNWYIYRVTLHESEAVQGMSGTGWASYGAAVEMDRHDRRLAETVRDAEHPENGLWVRMHHGRSGAANQYRWDRTGVSIGFERNLSPDHVIGAWFDYTEGDTELLDVNGDGDMKRYQIALYDTLTFGNNYLDFVGRIGRVSSEANAANAVYGTSVDYNLDFAAISAEFGHTLIDLKTGVFVEPQIQVQATYLDSFDYEAQRGIRLEADSEVSFIGRVGFRTGKQFRAADHIGELYFRADVLHQFTDGQDADFRAPQDSLTKSWGDFGTWANLGVGGYLNWKDNLSFQFDLERTTGGETDDTWLMSGRAVYRF